jgi:hypothetical protein
MTWVFSLKMLFRPEKTAVTRSAADGPNEGETKKTTNFFFKVSAGGRFAYFSLLEAPAMLWNICRLRSAD